MVDYEPGQWPTGDNLRQLREIVEQLLSIRRVRWKVRLIRSLTRQNDLPIVKVGTLLKENHNNWVLKILISPPQAICTWEVLVIIPPGFEGRTVRSEIIERATGPFCLSNDDVYANVDVSKLSIGQVHRVRIMGRDFETKRLWVATAGTMWKYGKDPKPYYGYIPLSNISPELYDEKWLSRYPITSNHKAVITEIKGTKVVFSLQTEFATGSTGRDDVFTGILGADGTMSISGYTQSPERTKRLLDAIADIHGKRDKGEIIPRQEVQQGVMKFFKAKYGVTKILPQAVAAILDTLSGPPFPDIEVSDAGYRLTDSGWEQLGGYEIYRQLHVDPTPPTPLPQPEGPREQFGGEESWPLRTKKPASVEPPSIQERVGAFWNLIPPPPESVTSIVEKHDPIETARQQARLEIIQMEIMRLKESLVYLEGEAAKIKSKLQD